MRTLLKTQLLLVASFVVMVLLSTGLVYFGVSNYSHNDFFRLLKMRAVTAAKVQLEGQSIDSYNSGNPAESDFYERLPEEDDLFIPLDETFDLEANAQEIGVPKAFFEQLLSQGEAEYREDEIFFKGIWYQFDGAPYAVVVKAENYYNSHHFAFLRRILIGTIVIAFILALLISAFLSKTIFKPLGTITKKVTQISSESLHLRLDSEHTRDELGQLVDTFNNMLDRIETSFETQNNFISNASHEFRTPLTVIIGEAEVALSKKRSQEDYEETLQIILLEAEKLDKKTQALLFLAQTGFNASALKGEIVRIDQILWDVKETVQAINPKSQINFDLDHLPENPQELMAHGSEQLLHLAFSNIINNACKYSDYQPVNVKLRADGKTVIVTVADFGIGIPSNEMEYIYDPFFRASNTNPYEGYGIGMPLSRNIIRMHNGIIQVRSTQHEGTTVEMVLPLANLSEPLKNDRGTVHR